jgi:hypothetical protein
MGCYAEISDTVLVAFELNRSQLGQSIKLSIKLSIKKELWFDFQKNLGQNTCGKFKIYQRT